MRLNSGFIAIAKQIRRLVKATLAVTDYFSDQATGPVTVWISDVIGSATPQKIQDTDAKSQSLQSIMASNMPSALSQLAQRAHSNHAS